MYEGRARRYPTPAQRREIWRRDRHCRFPGCANTLFHHPPHRSVATDRGRRPLNLALLCVHHHHLIHSNAWNCGRRQRDAYLHRPEGSVMTTGPRHFGPRDGAGWQGGRAGGLNTWGRRANTAGSMTAQGRSAVIRVRPTPGPDRPPTSPTEQGARPSWCGRRLAHVVDGEGGDGARRHGLHLDSGPVDRLDLGLDLDVVVSDEKLTPMEPTSTGWHMGISSAVRFAACIPVIRAVERMSPLVMALLATLVVVSGSIDTRQRARARRWVGGGWA